jgi:chromate reductase
LSASSRSTYAFDALRTTLTTMSGRFVTDASITVPLLGRNLDAKAVAADPELSRLLRSALDVFCRAIAQRPVEGDA